MGQKVNPVGFRLGVNRGWDSVWYAKKKDFGRLGLDNIEKRVLDRQEQDRINRILQSQRFNLLNNPFTQSVGFGLFD
mgnify:CR=1 FL=1